MGGALPTGASTLIAHEPNVRLLAPRLPRSAQIVTGAGARSSTSGQSQPGTSSDAAGGRSYRRIIAPVESVVLRGGPIMPMLPSPQSGRADQSRTLHDSGQLAPPCAGISARLNKLGRALQKSAWMGHSSWSAPGQKRRCDNRPVTSGLPPEADIHTVRQHVSNVPIVLQKSFCLTDHKFSGL
jgi:hypothetical protein